MVNLFVLREVFKVTNRDLRGKWLGTASLGYHWVCSDVLDTQFPSIPQQDLLFGVAVATVYATEPPQRRQ